MQQEREFHPFLLVMCVNMTARIFSPVGKLLFQIYWLVLPGVFRFLCPKSVRANFEIGKEVKENSDQNEQLQAP